MILRWGKAHEGIIEVGFEKWKIEEFVKNAMIHLRAGTEDVILELEMANVPFVVFSAGIGNIIEIFFDIIFKRPIANMHIISNMIHFNDQVLLTSTEAKLCSGSSRQLL